MAVVRTGDIVVIQNSDASGSQSVAVPADATLCVVIITGWNDSTNWIPANPITLGGVNLTTLQKTDNQVNNGQVWIGYLVNPSTGSQSLAWSWGIAMDEGANFCIAFYKGIDTASPVVSSGKQTTAGADLTGLSASAGDMMVGGVYSYSIAITSVTDSSQTQLAKPNKFNSCYGGFAEKDGGTGFYYTGGDYQTCVGGVFKQGVTNLSINVADCVQAKAQPV